ncbi:hypothetical protein ACLH0N_20955, partial [Aeromonas media]
NPTATPAKRTPASVRGAFLLSPPPPLNPLEATHNHDPEARIFEPITFFADGRAGYDIQYLTRDELSADVLRQYERYLVLSQDQGQDLLSGAPEHTPPETGA